MPHLSRLSVGLGFFSVSIQELSSWFGGSDRDGTKWVSHFSFSGRPINRMSYILSFS